MNRILRRPMFRTGGSAEGLTSGLAPRQGYYKGSTVNPFERTGNLPGGAYNRNSNVNTPLPLPNTNASTIGQKLNLLEAYAPRKPRTDTSMRDFLINWGLDIASRPPSGSIFSTAAMSGKEAFGKFQQAKQMEQAYGMKETEGDRALIAGFIKGMDDDKLSALMKDVKAGVEAGLFTTEAEGVKKLLQKKIYGVMDEPGEQKQEWIKWYMTNLQNKADVDPGIARAVAEHQYKIDFKEYPEEALKDMNRTKLYIKENHIKDYERDEDGEIITILGDGNYDYYYSHNQIFFEPQSGNLYKRVSKKGQAPVFQKVILDE